MKKNILRVRVWYEEGLEVIKVLNKGKLTLPCLNTDFKANIIKTLWSFKTMVTVGTKNWHRN